MKMDKAYRPLVKAARKRGWKLEITSGDHPRLVPPEGWTGPDGQPVRPVTFSATLGDSYRGLRNFKADLRRAGLDLP